MAIVMSMTDMNFNSNLIPLQVLWNDVIDAKRSDSPFMEIYGFGFPEGTYKFLALFPQVLGVGKAQTHWLVRTCPNL